MALVVKNTAQGLGHGHFDKLSWLLYDNGSEVVTDYGAARFLNIEAKYGGHYLPENKAYAKQTVAHNTLVVDEVSHSQGKYKAAKDLHPEILLFHTSDEIDVSSARMMHSYNDVSFVRTMAMIKNGVFEHPLVLDILRVASDSSHQYDLPLYYQGHIVNVTFPVKANSQMLKPLGEKSGYQFLWDRAIGRPKTPGLSQVTWLLNNRFYTLNMLAHRDSLVHFVELGANDPNFNLRRESGIIHRVKAVSDHVFVSALEGHGEYNPALEFTQNSYSNIAKLAHRAKKGKDYIEIKTRDGKTLGLALSYDKRLNKSHKIKVDGKTIRWKGFYHLFGS